MFLSLHRISAFWLVQPTAAPVTFGSESQVIDDYFSDILDRWAEIREDGRLEGGAIGKKYAPANLDETQAGYRWLRSWLVGEDPRILGRDSAFDLEPEAPDLHIESKANPFPAMNWQTDIPAQEGKLARAYLEVLVGTDVVLFHRFIVHAITPEYAEETCSTLRQNQFLAERAKADHLFNADICMVFEEARELAKVVAPTPYRSPHYDSCKLPAMETPEGDEMSALELRWVAHEKEEVGPRRYTGAIVTKAVETQSRTSKYQERFSHLRATGFITTLCGLMINDAKVAWGYDTARTMFRHFGSGAVVMRRDVETKIEARSRLLGPSMNPTDLESLEDRRLKLEREWSDVDTLVETCKTNTLQFLEVTSEIGLEDSSWHAQTAPRLRMLNRNLEAERCHLRGVFRGSKDSLETLRVEEDRSTSLRYAGELISFQGTRGDSVHGPEHHARFRPLVEFAHGGGTNGGSMPTCWRLSEELPNADGNQSSSAAASSRDDEQFVIFRPTEVRADHLDVVREHYVQALRGCSAHQLVTILDSLLREGSVICLSDYSSDASSRHRLPLKTVLQLEGVDTRKGARDIAECSLVGADASKPSAPDLIYTCPDPDSPRYRKTGEPREHWMAFQSLLCLVDALVRVLEQPTQQHAAVLQGDVFRLSRLLFLAGILRCIANHVELAKGYLRKAVDCALEGRRFAWAFCAAQVLQAYQNQKKPPPQNNDDEGHGSADADAGDPTRWRSRLAGAFLDVFDLPSAVAIARQDHTSQEDVCCRSSWISWWLRIPAVVLATVLLVVGLSVGFGASGSDNIVEMHGGRASALILTALVGLLAAPAAITIGTWGGSRALSLQAFYPRLLGAITLACIAFVTGPEVTDAIGKLHVATKVILGSASLVGAFAYLYWEVIRIGYLWKEGLGRCLDMLSLGFLEAVMLATFFVAVFGFYLNRSSDQPNNSADTTPHGMASKTAVPPNPPDQLNKNSAKEPSFRLIWPREHQATCEPLYFSPLYTLLMASMFLFLGIVIQLMFEPSKLGSVNDEDRS